MAEVHHDVAILREIDEKFDHLEERIEALEKLLKAGGAVVNEKDAVAMPEKAKTFEERPHKGPQWKEPQSPNMLRLQGDKGDPDENEVVLETRPRSKVEPEGRKTRKSIAVARTSQVDETILDQQTQEYYTFGESTWDLVIFIGTGALGPLGSLQTFILAIVNVVMQAVFVGIAVFNFLAPDITDRTAQEAFMWRRSSGHSLTEYDAVSKESLAQRVCNLDKSLHISGIQVDLVENIRKYLNAEGEENYGGIALFFSGQVLCLVALICWYLMVAKEVSHALALHRGIMAVKRGPTEIATRENPFTQVVYYRLLHITATRKIASFFLLIYRLIAAGLLIYVGTFFLVYTVNVTELILNAVALGIILDIDDLLFDALATTPGRHLVHQLDPLPMPAMPRFRGADAKSTFMTFLIPSLTCLIYFTMVNPFVTLLADVETNFCGGNKDFVWSVDKRRVVLLAPTDGGGWGNQTETIQTAALQEAMDLADLDKAEESAEYGWWLRDVSFINDAELLTLDDLIRQENPNCIDIADEVRTNSGVKPLLNYLRDALGNSSINSCADVKSYCDSLTLMPWELDGGKGYTTRMYCPVTCGCNNPGGDFSYVQGCPYGETEPCQLSDEFEAFRQTGNCSQKTAEELRNHEPWLRRIAAIEAFGNSEGGFKNKEEALKLALAMREHGCAFIQNITAENITWSSCYEWDASYPDWKEFKTLEWFCPSTCGCRKGGFQGSSGCPKPQGLHCDEVAECLEHLGIYYCSGVGPSAVRVPTFASELTLSSTVATPIAESVLAGYKAEVKAGLQLTISEIVKNGLEPWMVVLLDEQEGRLLRALQTSQSGEVGYVYELYLVPSFVSSNLSKTVRTVIEDANLTEAASLLRTTLRSSGVPVDGLGLGIHCLTPASCPEPSRPSSPSSAPSGPPDPA